MEIIGIVAGGCVALVIIDTIYLLFLGKKVRENEDFLYKVAKVVMVEKIKNLEQGLENLFNPKDEPKNNVKKTRANSKIK